MILYIHDEDNNSSKNPPLFEKNSSGNINVFINVRSETVALHDKTLV